MYSHLETLVHLANSFQYHTLLWFQYGLVHVLLVVLESFCPSGVLSFDPSCTAVFPLIVKSG